MTTNGEERTGTQPAESQWTAGHSIIGKAKPEPGVAMTETQYKRIQGRIRKEVIGGAATSIWLALAFAFGSFGASAIVALVTLDERVVSPVVRGRLQGAWVASAVLVLLCLVMHAAKWRRDRRQGNDICHEMDVACHRPTPETAPGFFRRLMEPYPPPRRTPQSREMS